MFADLSSLDTDDERLQSALSVIEGLKQENLLLRHQADKREQVHMCNNSLSLRMQRMWLAVSAF